MGYVNHYFATSILSLAGHQEIISFTNNDSDQYVYLQQKCAIYYLIQSWISHGVL